MSDLQCPARLLLAWPRAAVDGPADVRRLARQLGGALAGERVGMVYAADALLGDTVATDLGVARAPVPDLETVADLHRGETVVVVAGGADVLDAVRDRLVHGRAGDRPRGRPPLRQAQDWVVVRVDADADGWVVRAQDAGATSG